MDNVVRGRKSKTQIWLWWHSQFLQGPYPISYSVFLVLPTLPNIFPSATKMLKPILRGLLKSCHITSGYNPSLFSSSANQMKRVFNCYIWYLHNCLNLVSTPIILWKLLSWRSPTKPWPFFSPSPCSEDNLPGFQKGSYHLFLEPQTHFGFLDSVLFVYIPFWGTLCSGKCTYFEVR